MACAASCAGSSILGELSDSNAYSRRDKQCVNGGAGDGQENVHGTSMSKLSGERLQNTVWMQGEVLWQGQVPRNGGDLGISADLVFGLGHQHLCREVQAPKAATRRSACARRNGSEKREVLVLGYELAKGMA